MATLVSDVRKADIVQVGTSNNYESSSVGGREIAERE